MTTFLVVLAWLLCGVLGLMFAVRADSNAMSARGNSPIVVLGPLILGAGALLLFEDWLDRYAERHRRDK